MKQSSGFVELHNGPPWSKKFVPPRILIRFGRSPKGLLTPLFPATLAQLVPTITLIPNATL